MVSALERVTPALACPVCTAGLTLGAGTLRCSGGHAFDVARQGYASLQRGGAPAVTGDTAAMVAARDAFLGRGHYAPLARALRDAVAGVTDDGLCVDLAGGTGYYLRAVLEDRPGLLGLDLDLSKPALRRAARAHERLAAAAADVWQPLPVRTGAAAVVLSVFGPRNGPEIRRVLTPGVGRLLLVAPTPAHLGELVGPLGLLAVDPRKAERLDARLKGLEQVTETAVTYRASMGHADVAELALMGPSAHHVAADELRARAAALPDRVHVTVSVTLSSFAAA